MVDCRASTMPLPPPGTVARTIRTSARIALWTSLALTLAAGWLLARYSRPISPSGFARVPQEQALWEGVDFLAFEEVRLLRDYVRVDSSHPDADELAAAEFLAAQLAAAGVRATIERLGERQANLWAFVEGEDPRALVLHGHLDVEPALEEEGWEHPPFSGHIGGPWIYGRGMYDMKSLTIAQLLATIDAARSGRKPRRSLLFLQTSGEEIGSATGTRWILEEHPELVARFGTVLTEGGVIEAISPSDVKYWGIEHAQKRFVRTTFCARERAELEALERRLGDPGAGDPDPEISPQVRRFLAAYASSRGLEPLRELLAAPDRLPREADRFAALTPFMQALLRDELHTLPIAREPDGSWSMEVILHLLPGSELDEVASRLLPEWKTHGLARTPFVLLGADAASPVDHPDFDALAALVRARFPGVPVGPYFLPWAATDARFLRALEVPVYGFSPFPVVVFDTFFVARANERMQLPAYRTGVALYREAVRRLIE
jgi:acetylornithine deacetylase/succinyl-diaminopimelate desuccinylase-like protein